MTTKARMMALGLAACLVLCGAAHADLLGYWDFDDPSNPAVAPDSSGLANHGAVSGAAYTADGGGHTGAAGDRAMDFGAYNNGAHVLLPTAATGAFDSINTNNAATVSLWIKGDLGQPTSDTAFGFYSAGNTRQLQAHIPWSNQNIYFDTGGCCTGGVHRINLLEDDDAKWEGEWNHYAFVKYGSTSEIYQNGSLWHSGTTTATLGQIAKGYIGSSVGGGESYNGLIDDFAVWDKGITPNLVASLASGAATAATVTPAYHQAVLADTPFVYYRFDSDSGLNGSTLQDASGNARNGTYQNSVEMNPTAIGSQSAHFNGSNNRAAGTTQQPLTNALTVECWAQSDTAVWNNTGMLVSKRDAFIIHPNANSTGITFYVHSGGWRPLAFNLGSIPDFDLTDWHQYVGAFDGASGVSQLFVDGVLRASVDFGDALLLNSSSQPLYIGFDNSGARWFDGSIDEVAIYDYALSAEQIREHYFAGTITPEPATIGLLALGTLAALRRRRRRIR